jgi:hypothetical protein
MPKPCRSEGPSAAAAATAQEQQPRLSTCSLLMLMSSTRSSSLLPHFVSSPTIACSTRAVPSLPPVVFPQSCPYQPTRPTIPPSPDLTLFGSSPPASTPHHALGMFARRLFAALHEA